MICHVVMWNLKDEARGMGKVANAYEPLPHAPEGPK